VPDIVGRLQSWVFSISFNTCHFILSWNSVHWEPDRRRTHGKTEGRTWLGYQSYFSAFHCVLSQLTQFSRNLLCKSVSYSEQWQYGEGPQLWDGCDSTAPFFRVMKWDAVLQLWKICNLHECKILIKHNIKLQQYEIFPWLWPRWRWLIEDLREGKTRCEDGA
jgi:hypothetical protein